jgi:methyltransferase family protein
VHLRGASRSRAPAPARGDGSVPNRGAARAPDGFEGVGLQLLADAGIRDLVEFYEEDSQIVLPRLLAEGRRFDLAFIDGDHRFDAVFLDLIYAGRLVKARGIVFVDDAQLATVRKAIAFCVANLGWVVEEEGSEGDRHTWQVLRIRGAPRRPYTAFVDF